MPGGIALATFEFVSMLRIAPAGLAHSRVAEDLLALGGVVHAVAVDLGEHAPVRATKRQGGQVHRATDRHRVQLTGAALIDLVRIVAQGVRRGDDHRAGDGVDGDDVEDGVVLRR